MAEEEHREEGKEDTDGTSKKTEKRDEKQKEDGQISDAAVRRKISLHDKRY